MMGETKERIGVLGGSFDPPHLAHLLIAQDAFEALDLTEIIFIPASVSPFKKGVTQTPAELRLEMVRRAVADDGRFSVSDIEIRRGGVSYTVETIAELKRSRPDAEWVLLLGADAAAGFPRWRNAEKLVEMCEIRVLPRPGDDTRLDIGALPMPFARRVLPYPGPGRRIEISSTEIRRRVAEGRSIRYLVPPAVEAFIREKGLYKEKR